MKTGERKKQLQILPNAFKQGPPIASRQSSMLSAKHQTIEIKKSRDPYLGRQVTKNGEHGLNQQQRFSSALNLKTGLFDSQASHEQNETSISNGYRSQFYAGQWKGIDINDAKKDLVATLLQSRELIPTSHTLSSQSQQDHCNQLECKRRLYRKQMCKQHFVGAVLKTLRREMRNIYRGPDKAYGALDFTGVGHIIEKDFLESTVCTRVPFTQEDIKDFLFQTNAFTGTGQVSGMSYDSFKKMFFPHLYQIQDEKNGNEDQNSGGLDEEDQRNLKLKNLIANKTHHQEEIQVRLRVLEKKLKERFSNFDSVRKAFLGLDTDYDGYITVEDILRYFGQDSSRDFNFNDLKKLIMEKDSSGKGRLGYADFSKWVGNSIHQSEGFYFRHDSIKNPQYEQCQESPNVKQNEKCKQEASKQLINQTLVKTVIEKIKFQWKTIRKAFSDMNKERDSAIAEDELRFYLQHWGLNLTDEQFQYIFKMFDTDGDGMINYQDFHNTVGHEIHPGESLYFRQDKPHMMRINKCQHNKCWQPTVTLGVNFCELHCKMYVDQGLQYFQQLNLRIGREKWPKFIKAIRNQADRDEDYQQIFFDRFISIVQDRFGIPVTEKEKTLLKKTFPGRNEGEKVRINIQSLYDVKYNDKMNKVYSSVTMPDVDLDDVAVDLSGYIGVFHRREGNPGCKDIAPFSWALLSGIFSKLENNERNIKLASIMRTIKQIDRDNNGYVTSTELDDILKLTFPEELKGKNLKPLFKQFESLQNKILIDYKRFRDRLLETIKDDSDDHSSKVEIKRSQIAEKLQRLRDSKKGNASTICDSKSMNYSTVRESYAGRLGSNLKQDNKGLINNDEKTGINPLNRESLHQLLQEEQPKTPGSSAFDRKQMKMRAKQLDILGEGMKMTIDERRERLVDRLNLCKSTVVRQSANEGNILRRSLEGTKGTHLRKSLNQSVSDREVFQPYTSTRKGFGTAYLRNSTELLGTNNSMINFRRNNGGDKEPINVSDSIPNLRLSMEEKPKKELIDGKRPSTTAAVGIQRLSTDKFKPKLSKHLELIRQKISYEWKSIYRQLSSEDISGSGTVQQRKFDEVLQSNGVFVSNEDLTHIYNLFGGSVRGGSERVINFQRLSQELGLHQHSFNIMRATHSMINKMKTETRQHNFLSGSNQGTMLFKANQSTLQVSRE